jgi:hypothetical protein
MTSPTIISDTQEIAAPSPRVTGGILYAPVGSTLPTTALGAPDAAFRTLGRVSVDGVDRTEDRGNTEINDWGGNLIAVLQDKFGLTLKFKLLQVMNADVQKAAHGTNNVTVTPATTSTGTEIAAKINAALLDTGAWIVDGFYMKMSMRLVVPYGRVTAVGPMKWVHRELVMYDLTLKPFPDSQNNHAYQYWNDGVTTV